VLAADVRVAEMKFEIVSTTPNTVEIELAVDGVPITVRDPFTLSFVKSYGSMPWEESGGWYLFLVSPVIPAGALTCRIVSSDGVLQQSKITIIT